jgi:hypothetical protein
MPIASIAFRMVIVLAGITGDASSLFYVEWGRIFQIASGMHAL